MPFGISPRWRVIALLAVLAPLSCVLVQCGQAPPAATLAANVHATGGDSFEDRFPAPQFKDRFPSDSESIRWPSRGDPLRSEPSRQRTVRTEKITPDPAPAQSSIRVAAYAPTTLPLERPRGEDLTRLVSMKSSAFPYFGENPRSEAPFLNISKGDRKGRRSYSGKVYWQDETYNDSRVLVGSPVTRARWSAASAMKRLKPPGCQNLPALESAASTAICGASRIALAPESVICLGTS